MVRFLKERVWAHLPSAVPLRQRLWASLLWGFALPVFLSGARWLFHPSAGFSPDPALTVMRVTVPLAVLLPLPGVGPWVYLTVLRVFSLVGFFISHAFLVLIFYAIVTPFGIVLRMSGRDPLQVRRTGEPPRWSPAGGEVDRRRYYRMF